MDFLKHREDRNWIHSRNEAAEDEAVQDADGPPEPAQERDAIQAGSDEASTDTGVDKGQQQDRAQVIKERPHGHEVARIEDDGRKKVDEEDICIQDILVRVCNVGEVEKSPHNKAHDNEETTLWNYCRELGIQMECCTKKQKQHYQNMSY